MNVVGPICCFFFFSKLDQQIGEDLYLSLLEVNIIKPLPSSLFFQDFLEEGQPAPYSYAYKCKESASHIYAIILEVIFRTRFNQLHPMWESILIQHLSQFPLIWYLTISMTIWSVTTCNNTM